MGVTIRPIDFEHDRSTVIALLSRNREFPADYPLEARYAWMYMNNPDGVATGWLAVDDQTRQAVGFTVALPRRMSLAGERVMAWNCADFSIDRAFRTLGVAAKLRRAAREEVDRGSMSFLYAHPNERMLAVHKRVGHTPIGEMRRYARLVHTKPKLKSLDGVPVLRDAVAGAADGLIHVADCFRLQSSPHRIEHVASEAFGQDFTDLYLRVEPRFGVSGVRDADYLNWRYARNPVYRPKTVAAYSGHQLVGYLVYGQEEQTIHVRDILVINDRVAGELLSFLIRQFRNQQELGTISAVIAGWNPYATVLKELGFRARQDSRSKVVVHAAPSFKDRSTVLCAAQWYLTVGDRDI